MSPPPPLLLLLLLPTPLVLLLLPTPLRDCGSLQFLLPSERVNHVYSAAAFIAFHFRACHWLKPLSGQRWRCSERPAVVFALVLVIAGMALQRMGRSAGLAQSLRLATGRGEETAMASRPDGASDPMACPIIISELVSSEDMSPVLLGVAPHGLSSTLTNANDSMPGAAYWSRSSNWPMPDIETETHVMVSDAALLALVSEADQQELQAWLSSTAKGGYSVATGSYCDRVLETGGSVTVIASATRRKLREQLIRLLHSLLLRGGPIGRGGGDIAGEVPLSDGYAYEWVELYSCIQFRRPCYTFRVIAPPGYVMTMNTVDTEADTTEPVLSICDDASIRAEGRAAPAPSSAWAAPTPASGAAAPAPAPVTPPGAGARSKAALLAARLAPAAPAPALAAPASRQPPPPPPAASRHSRQPPKTRTRRS